MTECRHRAALGLAGAVILGAGCAASAVNEERSVSISIDPIATSSVSAPASSPAPRPTGEVLLSVRRPSQPACVISTPGELVRRVDVGVSSDTPPIGSILSATSWTVLVPTGDADAGLVVEAEANGFFVRGVATPTGMPLHANRVAVLGGVVVPRGVADLIVTRAEEDGVTVQYLLPTAIRISGASGSISGRLPCSILSFEVPEFDPYETLLGTPIAKARLKDARIPLSTSVDGPPVATLAPDPGSSQEIQVLAREKKRVKIAWETDDVIAFGWVDAAHVQPAAPPLGAFGSGLGGLGLSGVGEGARPRLAVCHAEIPIHVAHGPVEATLGLLRPNQVVRILEESERGWSVDLHAASFSANDGVRLWIAKEDLPRCEETRPSTSRPG